jgi:hypothetical protein
MKKGSGGGAPDDCYDETNRGRGANLDRRQLEEIRAELTQCTSILPDSKLCSPNMARRAVATNERSSQSSTI